MSKQLQAEQPSHAVTLLGVMTSLLDAMDRPLLVADRVGTVLFANVHAQDRLTSGGFPPADEINLFKDLLKSDARSIFGQLERGEQEVILQVHRILGIVKVEIDNLNPPSRPGVRGTLVVQERVTELLEVETLLATQEASSDKNARRPALERLDDGEARRIFFDPLVRLALEAGLSDLEGGTHIRMKTERL